jgi:mannitol/fructose-specific phosphotransferase system IIA component (Ntr-type)
VILAVFFTLAGMHLSPDHVAMVGLVATLLFTSRIAGKLIAAHLALRLAHAPSNVRRNLGLALTPQAGVAVALVILIQDDPACASIAELFASVVLAVVVANEIVGPILTRIALVRSGEAGMDRTRLIDFIQEENIVIDFEAGTKREAIAQLVELMGASHHLSEEEREMLLETTLRREREASTCLGGGLSVPHGILPRGQSMIGVMGLSRRGIPLGTPDGRLVHCMVLLGTSSEERDRHLQVLAALARTIGMDPSFRAQLFGARSPAHASELLHGEESVSFNYFLDDEEQE